MNLRNILNRLTEEELELLQEEIEGDLYEEIEKVIDDKRQPSLFVYECNEGDVFIEQGPMRSRYVYKIKSARNPYFTVETIYTVNGKILFSGFNEYKAGDVMGWRKVSANMWESFENLLDLKEKKIMAVGRKIAKDFNSIWDQLNNEGK